ncbi:uncharacterized protein H6S33_009632 [Morchella sextelata]|uniref:uncharacterized protein n=1 Tax=Morchella sextelata TaxID=1174677 RepID=UPI001D039966|nr:uncharacterized protein H6S33_009632 [Morchella sextelata]KAH0613252.1 hypothetical protein H6S33_009632 [Morchella sextelata]
MPDSQEPTLTITPPGMAVPEHGGLAKRRQQRLLTSGPFEFTKLSSQIELLMARSRMASVDDPSHITKYQPKGTFQSASSIVKARGFGGLYSGFHLHFSGYIFDL